MPQHDIVFVDGVCITPPGVDPEIWQLELPSILGIAYGPDLDVDSPAGYSAVETEAASPRPIDISGEVGEDASMANTGGDMGLVRQDAHEHRRDNTSVCLDDTLMYASPRSDYALTEIDPDDSVIQSDVEATDGAEDSREVEGDGPVDRWEQVAHITLDVPYSVPPAELIEQWNVPLDYVHMLAIPAISMEEPPVHPLELFAFRMLRRGSLNLDAFHEMQCILLQSLPQLTKARKRRCVEFANGPKGGASFSLYWGSFVMGGMHGLTRNSQDFPWMTRLLVAMIRGHRNHHVFSSLGLHLNTYMAPHLDKHNHPALPSFIIPCGRWQGGGLWVCDRSLPQQASTGDMMGRVYNLGDPGVLFRSHWLHASMAWQGQRMVLVAYANNNIQTLSEGDRAQLTALGFDSQY